MAGRKCLVFIVLQLINACSDDNENVFTAFASLLLVKV